MLKSKDVDFTTRVLMSLREDIIQMTETAERVRVQFDAVAKENGIQPIKPERAKRRAA